MRIEKERCCHTPPTKLTYMEVNKNRLSMIHMDRTLSKSQKVIGI